MHVQGRLRLALPLLLLVLGTWVGPGAHGDTRAAGVGAATPWPNPGAALAHDRAALRSARAGEPPAPTRLWLARAGAGFAARAGETFYLDSQSGSDRNSGTSPTAPWRTLARAQRERFRGGDTILLHGGLYFGGSLRLSPSDLGATSTAEPLTISSYGGGEATIGAGLHDALSFRNVAGVRISDLRIAGAGTLCPPESYGILFLAEGARRTLAEGIAIEGVEVHGFCYGIGVGTGDDRSRFSGVSISDSSTYDNGEAGVMTFDPAQGHHDVRHVRVDGVRAYDNVGIGGIALFGVEYGLVEHSVAFESGHGVGGAVGIWAFDANDVTIRESESYDNRTNLRDGDGFDLDGGVSNSVLEYDYAHDDDGIGFLVCACVSPYESHNDTVRFDISENDGSSGQPSALFIYGGAPASNIEAYNDSFYSSRGAGPLVEVNPHYETMHDVSVRDSLLAAGAGKPLLQVHEAGEVKGLRVQGNDWWSAGAFEARWDGSRLRSLAQLRASTGLERLGSKPTGIYAEPQLCELGAGATEYPAPPSALLAYRPRSGSPLIGAGLDLPAMFGIDVGGRDFSGGPLPAGGDPDIGAELPGPSGAC